MTRLPVLVVAFVGAGWMLAASCGADETTAPPTPATIVVFGNGQHGIAGQVLPSSLVAEVRDARERPLGAVPVRFTVTSGGGAVTDTVVLTGTDGRAAAEWFLGPDPGESNGAVATAGTIVATFAATAGAASPGTTYHGRNQYIEYGPGELPVIISAPHGGLLVPPEIPDRTSGTLVRDTNTEELARAISQALAERTGKRPHLIICRLRRTKLDANREIVEAAQGSRPAQRAWFEYHSFIEAAKHSVIDGHGRGLFIDLHGHGHPIARVELGYILTASELRLDDAMVGGATYEMRSSIRALSVRSPASFAELLRGPTSLGALLEAEGFPAVPSFSQPDPGVEPYFSGGYNTARHGSAGGGEISGVQMETHFVGVRDTPAARASFAERLVSVLDAYLVAHAGLDVTPAIR